MKIKKRKHKRTMSVMKETAAYPKTIKGMKIIINKFITLN
jgi:hypothetical protein